MAESVTGMTEKEFFIRKTVPQVLNGMLFSGDYVAPRETAYPDRLKHKSTLAKVGELEEDSMDEEQ